MFGFMKKHSEKDKEEKEKKKREKLEKDQKRSSKSLTADELIRLEEAKQALQKKSGPTTGEGDADERQSHDGQSQSETSSMSSPQRMSSVKSKSVPLKSAKIPPATQPKPPKKGILKGAPAPSPAVRGNLDDTTLLEENTLANEIMSGNELDGAPKTDIKSVVSTPDKTSSASKVPPVKKAKPVRSPSRTSTASSSSLKPSEISIPSVVPVLVRPPSPVDKSYENVDLQLPGVAAPFCPKPRDLILKRQPSGDFGFTLRKGTILERGLNDNSESKRIVIFAEPGPKNLNTGLLPGDRLIEVNDSNVENSNREMIIELIKKSGDVVHLKVQPIPELSELSMRSGMDGDRISVQAQSVGTGSLQRSGSMRYRSKEAKTEDQLASEKAWLSAERVWLVHKGGFAAARVLKPGTDGSFTEGKCKVKLEHGGEVLEVDEDDVEKANPPQFDRVEDLATLRYLNESCLLHTLRQRYGSNLIHSNAGRSLVIINPMHPLSIYTDKVIQMFKGCRPEDMPPHIYATAQIAYRNMMSSRRDQSVVLLGRSGSGKTTSSHNVLQYLTSAYGSINNVFTADKLAAIFTLLDSFGKSRTILNTNASNFTQLTSVDFDQTGQIISASVQVLMLEKSRLVQRPEGEPSFHVLYHFLAGIDATLRKELYLESLTEPNSFMTPLQRPEDHQRGAQSWAKVHHSLELINTSEAEMKAIFSVLAAIYHLGVAGVTKGPNNKHQFARPSSAQHVADILGTTVEELSRTVFAGGSQPQTLLSPAYRATSDKDSQSEPVSGSDCLKGFIVGLFTEVFQSVVAIINRSLSSSYRTMASILIVDTPGFRNPSSCGRNTGATFEDFCHNYVQERLQLLFHDSVFSSELDLYAQENIECDFEPVASSSAALVQIIDKLPQGLSRSPNLDSQSLDKRGLLWIIDEEAISSGSSDDTFLKEILHEHGNEGDGLLVPGSEPKTFTLNHLQGTSPVNYNVSGWLKSSRESAVSRVAGPFLMDSKKSEISELFSTTGRSTIASIASGSIVGMEGAASMRRVSSMRRTFTSGAAGVKRRSISLQVKFQMDTLVEIIRKTRIHFIHCLLPQENAGLCDLRQSQQSFAGKSPVPEDVMINVPLIRLQLRGAEILEAIRLYKQGYPEHMQFLEFRRRFEILVSSGSKPNEPIVDEKEAAELLLNQLDVDSASFRLGLSQVFFHSGVLAQLDYAREEKVSDWVIRLQAVCRGNLGKKNLQKLKLQHLAVSCIQKNIRKFMAIREWPWWRLYTKVKPVLNVHRTEEELKDREIELEQLKQKLEKSEKERLEFKQAADRLEAKMSELVAEFQDEHSTSNQASELLDQEMSERLRLEKELKELQTKYSSLQNQFQRTEMELIDARMLATTIDSDVEDDGDDSAYRDRFERFKRESDFSKKKLLQQHEEELEQLESAKKLLERKLADTTSEVEEQGRTAAAMKRKLQRHNQGMGDLKLHLEEQTSRNAELEKKQRKFDSELSKVNELLKMEKAQREKLQREKDELVAQNYNLDQELKGQKMDYDMQAERLKRLEVDIVDMASTGKDDKEALKLKQQKNELDRKVQEQEEELDEQAGTIQQLEQAKLRLEMAQEKMRQQHAKEMEEKENELEDLKGTTQKKLRALEMQVEEEYEDKQKYLKEKRELERKLQLASEQKPARDKDVEHMLRRDLKRTKALLQDAQLMLQKYKDGAGNRSTIKQLRNQLEDAEFATAAAIKAKKSIEADLQDFQRQVDDLTRAKIEAEERSLQMSRDKNELQSRLEENEEELGELMKKYKAAVQQHSIDLIKFEDQSRQIESMLLERETLKEEMARLQSRTEYFQTSTVDRETITRLEAKIRDLEAKLDYEQSTRHRAEVQLGRLKEQVEQEADEKQSVRSDEMRNQEQHKQMQRRVRELEEEMDDVRRKEAEATKRKQDLERKLEDMESDYEQSQNDLQLAFKRIADLQAVIEDDVDNCDDNDSDELDSDFAGGVGETDSDDDDDDAESAASSSHSRSRHHGLNGDLKSTSDA